MSKTRVKSGLSYAKKAHLIQGVFYQDESMPGVILRPAEVKPKVRRGTPFPVPFHGIIWGWSPAWDVPEGVMWDAHGTASLRQTDISDEGISFYQAYNHRSDYIGFRFRRKEANIWQGRWKGDEDHGEGLAWCILTEVVNMALTDPTYLTKVLRQ